MRNSSAASSFGTSLFVRLFFAVLILAACFVITQKSDMREARPAGPVHPLMHGPDGLRPHEAAPQKKAELVPSRISSGGREIEGFSARMAPPAEGERPSEPAGLKPEEAQAWEAMERRQAAGTKQTLESFYPARYGDPFVVEGSGVRVAVRPVGGEPAAASVEDGDIVYRSAYPATDSKHVVTDGRSEEFLYLADESAPREFKYEIAEVSPGTSISLIEGEVRFTNEKGQGVRIERPWLIDATGTKRTDIIRWEYEAGAEGAKGQLTLRLTSEKLQYPLVIDPSWSSTGSMTAGRYLHTATLLQNGKVLVAGGAWDGGNLASADVRPCGRRLGRARKLERWPKPAHGNTAPHWERLDS